MADYLVVESTYGDRTHGPEDPQAALAAVINRTAARGGVVVIPAFAVGRTQSLLYHIHALLSRRAIPGIPVFLDSPMAADATRLMREHRKDHRLDDAECAAVCGTAAIANSVEASKAIDRRSGPMIIIAASGMASGGRVLFHLERFGPHARNTILFTGYQAAGTRGAAMLAGAKEVKIHGGYVPVRAEVVALHGLSAHADADEIMGWLRGFERPPRQTFITHGEPTPADALRHRIEEELHWQVRVPEPGERVDLSAQRSKRAP
jgi:metallo-beta-lactamase family protein